jgi:hypothetical protein
MQNVAMVHEFPAVATTDGIDTKQALPRTYMLTAFRGSDASSSGQKAQEVRDDLSHSSLVALARHDSQPWLLLSLSTSRTESTGQPETYSAVARHGGCHSTAITGCPPLIAPSLPKARSSWIHVRWIRSGSSPITTRTVVPCALMASWWTMMQWDNPMRSR